MVCLATFCFYLHDTFSLISGRDVRNTEKPMLQYIESHNDDVTEVGSLSCTLITFSRVDLCIAPSHSKQPRKDAASKRPCRRRFFSSRSVIIFCGLPLLYRQATMCLKLPDYAANHLLPLSSSTSIPRTQPFSSPAAPMVSSTYSTRQSQKKKMH